YPERRFEREVQAASRLTSPNTIEIYDYGRTADGVFYYAMEFLDGLTLGSLSRETGRIPASRVIHILRQVCVSLHEAHEIEIIHRDIKPGNIMLCERGGNYDVVKVLDFGLVKHLGPDEENTRTRLSEITGTPLYMAPERIRASESVDARSDLYSVGAVGYFLLSGAHLFSAPGDVEVLHQVANVPPQPLSEFTALEVPPGLEELIMNCLAKDPGERPASAADMIESLEALEAAYPWSRQEAKAWWRSRASQAATPPSP
ncbi:MAG: serine/threonine-protein kinase, partial [Verrucomicrobiales bacterium]